MTTELKQHINITQGLVVQLVNEFDIHNYFTRAFYTLQFYWYNILTADYNENIA
jgi:hypothetical protein